MRPARVGRQFKRRANAASVHNECGLPAFDFKLDLTTHRDYAECDLPALGVNSSGGVQFLSRELNAACPYLAPIQTAFLQYARMGEPTETIGAPFQSRKPSHSGKFRKSAMRETKNASSAGGIPV